jgi:hypothetical protein
VTGWSAIGSRAAAVHAGTMRRDRVWTWDRVVVLIGVGALLVSAGFVGGCAGPAAPAAPTARTPAPAGASAAPTLPSAEVRVFFVPGGADPCGTVAPVVRRVAGPVTANVVLRELLAGPTADETAAGFTSLLGPPTADALLGVEVVGGIARVSLSDLRQVIPNASSSCGSAALLGALDATLAQLPGIHGARYSFGGDEAAFYEWLQLSPPD